MVKKSSSPKKEKSSQIRRLAMQSKPNINSLRSLALSTHGFVSSELRRHVWPLLLGLDRRVVMPDYDSQKLLAHKYYHQVVLDVNRSVKRFPHAMKEDHRNVLQEQLTKLIMKVLVNNPELHYYQGFHDICVTFLQILGKEISYVVVDHLTQNHLRDFMDEDMNRTRSMLNYLYPVLRRTDEQLHDFMVESGVGNIFCLSWLITWFGHVLDDMNHIVRLYDFFLASHPLMPIYMAAAIVLYRRDEVLNEQCDMCLIHVLLSKIPSDLPFEQLILEANSLFLDYPPEELAPEAEFQYNNSKTMRNYAKFEKHYSVTTPSSLRQINSMKDSSPKQVKSEGDSPSLRNIVGSVTMWSVTVAIGAAIVAMQYASSELW